MAAAAYVARTLVVFVGRLYQYRKRSGLAETPVYFRWRRLSLALCKRRVC
jgi:hypothetical protein